MRRSYLLLPVIIICFSVVAAGRVWAAEEFAPWHFDRPTVAGKQKIGSSRDLSFPAALIYEASSFFSRYISPVDGDRCAMYPTCSMYSRQAVLEHGFLVGVVMTIDRLMHESNEIDTAPLIEIGGAYRYRDGVERNDFWWYERN